MHIDRIRLLNYRNYESLDINLGKKATVLIGKNGVGKTNMITALKQSLSFIFTKNTNISQPSFVAESGQAIHSFETTDATRKYNPTSNQYHLPQWPIKIETTMVIDQQEPLQIVFERVNLSEGIKESYSQMSIRFWDYYQDLENMPVLAFYSDAFPHEKVKMGTKIKNKLDSEYGLSQADGYYNWDDPRDCSNVWQMYFSMQYRNYTYGHTEHNEKLYLNSIRECLINFSKPLDNLISNKDFILKDISLVARGKSEVMVLKFENGMEADLDSLPAGYKRVFSMVFDIANRAFILNNHCDPSGVVFIDEIDLHLHPSLSQEILERMQKTFPHLQFIVSTHSPLLLSNYKSDKTDFLIYSITRNEDLTSAFHPVEHTYGIDYNTLLTDLMGTRLRNTILRQYVQDYQYWKSANEQDLANDSMNAIIRLVGENSDLVLKLKG